MFQCKRNVVLPIRPRSKYSVVTKQSMSFIAATLHTTGARALKE